jgi:hypothetical protein
MARITLSKVCNIDGVDLYAPLDAEDEKLIAGQDIIVCEIKAGKSKRTTLQNKAIHKYCAMLSEALNEAGLDMKLVLSKLSKKAQIPWTPNSVKERLWRPVQINTFGKESSASLNTDEVGAVYEALNVVTCEQLGVGVSFPSRFTQGL